MHSSSDPRPGPTSPCPAPDPALPGTGGEPIAIVGLAALYPDARGLDAFWSLMADPEPGCSCTPRAPAPRPADRHGSRSGGSGVTSGTDPGGIDLARYGIPPAQAGSMAAMQKLMLEASRQCLTDAGYAQRPLPSDRTDVLAGTCFGLDRQYANAARVESARWAEELRDSAARSPQPAARAAAADAARQLADELCRDLGASPHDRVGEMGSTIPARIAGIFKLRGRTMAVESADMTSHVLLAHAAAALRTRTCDAALVLAGQLHEGPLPRRALAAKGLGTACTHPLDPEGRGYALGEGVGAVLLKRLSTAERDGDRVYAVIRSCALGHDPRPGSFRYTPSAAVHRAVARRAHDVAPAAGPAAQYAECAGTGLAAVTAAELAALAALQADAAPGSVVIGSVRDRLGHTFANSGLAGLTKVALALYRRRLPPHWTPPDGRPATPPGGPFRTLSRACPWPSPDGGAPRRAVLGGASLTGSVAYLVIEEYDPRPASPVRTVPATGSTAREPVAVVACGGAFGGAGDPEAVWRMFESGRDMFAPLPDHVLDRGLHHAPGALSLTHSYTDLGAWMPSPPEPPAGVPCTPARWAAMDAAQRVGLTVGAQFLGRRGSSGSRGGPVPTPGPGSALGGQGLVVVGSNLSLTRERLLNAALGADDLEAAVERLPALAGLPPHERKALAVAAGARCAARTGPLGPADLDGCLAGGIAALLVNEFGVPAVPLVVEAACASSLAAIDVAVTALRAGTADFAVAGGVELPCNPRDMILCSALGLLSHTKITPFGPAADGFTPGDGGALFLLKRLRDARRDGDRILGVIRGIGASNDAKSLIAPDAEGQARAVRDAFGQTDFGPESVDYVEAHGTGTRVGDRVEIEAAASTYGAAERRRPLRIGSAKSFLGHTFAAAGAAGLLRVLLALRAGRIPPHANLDAPDQALGLDAVPAVVPTRAEPWPAHSGRPRRAGVSSFGTGGINFHLLVEEHMDGSV
jgi:beta-ketoacyl ACP synthase